MSSTNSIASVSPSPSPSPSPEWSQPIKSTLSKQNRTKKNILPGEISISEDGRPNSSQSDNTSGSLYWNASLLYYGGGLAISPKIKPQNLRSSVSLSDMNRSMSPVQAKYLKKSPSNDSGTYSSCVASCNGDEMSPLRRRHLSCGSSSTTSSSSMGSSKEKTKGLTTSSSMRLMKAISKRPSLSSFMERTQSLGRYGRNKSASPVGNYLEEETITTSNSNETTTTAPMTSSALSSTAKAFRDSFRAARNLLPSTTKVANYSTKTKATDSSVKKEVSSSTSQSDINGSASTINYSTPNTPEVSGKSFGSSDSLSKNKVLKKSKKEQTLDKKRAVADVGKSNKKTDIADPVSKEVSDSAASPAVVVVSQSIGSKLKKTKDTNKKALDDTASVEKVPTKKISLVKSLTRKIQNRSKDNKERKEKEMSVVDSKSKRSFSAISESKNLSESQEILELDNEPKVRTPKTVRQRASTSEKDREFNEMEVSEEALEISQREKLSQQNVTSKSSKKAKAEPKKSQNVLPSVSVTVEDGKKKSSKKGKKVESLASAITIVDDDENKLASSGVEKIMTHENDPRGKDNKDKKKSWSDVVSSSDSKSQETLLETKLDLEEVDGTGEDEIKYQPGAMYPKLADSNNTKLLDNHKKGSMLSNGTAATATNFTNKKKDLKNHIIAEAEILQVNDVTTAEEKKDLYEGQPPGSTKDDEDEEPSCTESFRQLKPFNFNLDPVAEGKRERLYKVLVVGELGSGKTSIIKRYVHQFFSQHYRATIGVDFALKVLRWDSDTVVRLQLWDIAGQERFGSMTRVYYKEAVGAFVVFDVTRSATLEAVPKWKADLDSKVALPDGRPIPTILLANKSDQPKEGIAANREKMNDFCQQQGFSAWFETSARDNINIDESANFLVSKILEMDRWSQEPLSPDPDKVDLSANGKHKSNEASNCAC